jgi:hypothetical protein
LEDLVRLAELLNGKRPALAGPAGAEKSAYAVWREMKAKYPGDFMTSQLQLIAWHQQQAALASQEGQWTAALFHYEHLLALRPGDQSVSRLHAEAQRLAQVTVPVSP